MLGNYNAVRITMSWLADGWVLDNTVEGKLNGDKKLANSRDDIGSVSILKLNDWLVDR